jgi:hypothetical protein
LIVFSRKGAQPVIAKARIVISCRGKRITSGGTSVGVESNHLEISGDYTFCLVITISKTQAPSLFYRRIGLIFKSAESVYIGWVLSIADFIIETMKRFSSKKVF